MTVLAMPQTASREAHSTHERVPFGATAERARLGVRTRGEEERGEKKRAEHSSRAGSSEGKSTGSKRIASCFEFVRRGDKALTEPAVAGSENLAPTSLP
jgi:hypothetical protein